MLVFENHLAAQRYVTIRFVGGPIDGRTQRHSVNLPARIMVPGLLSASGFVVVQYDLVRAAPEPIYAYREDLSADIESPAAERVSVH